MSASNKRKAGKSSGVKRAKLARLRRFLVLSAFEGLKPTYQLQPFSDAAIDALEEKFRRSSENISNSDLNLDLPLDDYETIVRPSPRHSDKWQALFDEFINMMMCEHIVDFADFASLRRASRDTLIKDLKALGIRSKYRKQRSG